MTVSGLECHGLPPMPRLARAAAWAELLSARMQPLAIANFDADQAPPPDLLCGPLGPVEVLRLRMGRGTISRRPAHIAHQADPDYCFMLALAGTLRVSHYGRSALLGPDDLGLCNGQAPYDWAAPGPVELLILRVPASELRQHMPQPDNFCGLHVHAGEGLCDSTASLCRSVFEQMRSGLPAPFQARIARTLLDALATSFAIAFDAAIAPSAVLTARNARTRLFIEENLRDPELSPRRIAQTLRVSPRYLRTIFAAGQETVSAYVLRRRLEECARQMADPAAQSLSITDIAFGWGFNSASHFARSFRDAFGLTPRDYRQQQLALLAGHAEDFAPSAAAGLGA